MSTYRFEMERSNYRFSRSFEQTIAAFEEEFPAADMSVQIDHSTLGAALFMPTAIVPPLLVTHALIFRVLMRPTRKNVEIQK